MKLAVLTGLMFVFFSASDQTGGLSYVVSIESKSRSIKTNNDKINQLEAELAQPDPAFVKSLQDIRSKITALEKERDGIIADMKVGARCSQCNKWKTELEKSGQETFAQHLGKVKGYAIPATTAELEAVRTKYRELIAYQKVLLQRAEKQDPSAQKREAINKLKQSNSTVCDEITAESKRYEDEVFTEAKAKHEIWIYDIMVTLADQHIAEDRASLTIAKKAYLKSQYDKAVADMAERHRKEIADRPADLREVQQQHAAERLVLKNNFTEATKGLDAATAKHKLTATQYNKLVLQKKAANKNKNIIYVNLIAAECNRMFIAAREGNCTIYNDIRFKVGNNYNTQEACISTLTASSLGRSFSASTVGCVGKNDAYVTRYRSFASGLDDVEKEAVRQSTFYIWYQKLLE